MAVSVQGAVYALATFCIVDRIAVGVVFAVSLAGVVVLWRRYVAPPEDDDFAGNFRIAPTAAALDRPGDPLEAARERDYRVVLWFMVALSMIARLLWGGFLLLFGPPR